MDVMALDDVYHVVRFRSVDDYEFAKYGGPWSIMDHYLIVQDWRPNFDPKSDKTERVLVWVRFPDLPMEYYDYPYLMKLGKKIGEPKYIDETTSIGSKGRFARMCAEVDLTKPLLSKFTAKLKVRHIEYEGMYQICFHCGVYGHAAENCPQKPSEEADTATETGGAQGDGGGQPNKEKDQSIQIRPEIVERYGTWMLAPKKPYRYNRANNGKNKNPKGKDENGNQGPNNSINVEKGRNNGKDKGIAVADQGIRSDSIFVVLSEEVTEEINELVVESNEESLVEKHVRGTRNSRTKKQGKIKKT
ncbi:PREDICTED: uncharacterized protein LOC109184469 [Ipomoea nil]|uniref:uncharacterized protein LOC109184469 n=1 Tax=Ipomoea nil TaxID=35883 RepID=UPI000900C86B|nr:PREDICTED: uncharacterized protein LOC109184469 [Ipomoea nil]